MTGSLLNSTPAEFAKIFVQDPMALVKVLNQFCDAFNDPELFKLPIIRMSKSRVDYDCDSPERQENAANAEATLISVLRGLKSASLHDPTLHRIAEDHGTALQDKIDLLALCQAEQHVWTSDWFPDTIGLIESELNQDSRESDAKTDSDVTDSDEAGDPTCSAPQFKKDPDDPDILTFLHKYRREWMPGMDKTAFCRKYAETMGETSPDAFRKYRTQIYRYLE